MSAATLLIVEDDGILAANLEIILTGLGYRVLGPVATGEEAITLLQEQVADLVLMDIELAGTLNGIETAEHLGRSHDLPIVFLTGFSHDPLLEEAKIVAPYGYLIKPVPERELAATVAMSLHRHALDRQLKESRLALETSEANYRHLFEHSPLGIFRSSLNGKLLLANEEMARIIGFHSASEAVAALTNIGRQLYVDPERRRQFVELLREHGEVASFEFQARRKDGETFWLSMDARLPPGVHAHVSGDQIIDGFAIDITTRKTTELALRESEQLHRTYLMNTPYGVFVADLKGNFVQVNPAACCLSGYEQHELLTMKVLDLHPKDNADEVLKDFETVIQEGRIHKEMELCVKGGTHRWWSVTAVNIQNHHILGFCNDITERKQAELLLRESENRYRELVENANSIILRMDRGGRLTFFNEYAQRFFGFSAEEALGRNVIGTIVPENDFTGHDLRAMIADLGRSPMLPATNEHENMRRDGSRVWVSWTNKILYDANGEASELLCVGNDITERKRMEEEQSRLQAQLVHSQKMEAIGTLAGGIAHDFNNILGAVLGYAEMAREDSPLDSTLSRNLDRVIEAGTRAASLVKQILAFSRQQESKRVPLDTGFIVKEAVKLLRPSLPSTITISQRINAKRSVLADPTQLHQVLMNLATNAFHAMEQTGGSLEIHVDDIDCTEADLAHRPGIPPGPFVRLSVADTGPGIPLEIRDRIFDPYFTTKEVGKGTGMGLAIVDGIVRSSGGFITCESKPGKGTVFTIFLPACNTVAIATSDEVEKTATGSGHILLVDDEEMLIEMGQSMLERLGYQVTTRTSSLEALTTFQNDPQRFDAVITDQTMPGMTGLDLARRLLQIRPELPIILCTGYSNLVNEAQARAYGIKGFAMKPLTKKEVAALLKVAMKGSSVQ